MTDRRQQPDRRGPPRLGTGRREGETRTGCPSCGASAQDSDVLESRERSSDHVIRRRRLCPCGVRYTTFESNDDPADTLPAA
jgi:hypothetical protein